MKALESESSTIIFCYVPNFSNVILVLLARDITVFNKPYIDANSPSESSLTYCSERMVTEGLQDHLCLNNAHA
jgi:hypothetical protein